MNALDTVAAYAAARGLLPPGGRVLAAVSGGADSVCMLHILLRLGEREGFSVAAAHFNHMLRGAESDGDEDFVRALCARWNVPFASGRGDVAAAAAAGKRGVEETARDMRYAFLRQAAEALGARVVATAHTSDDNAETVLMHLARGAGLTGLCGIAPKRDGIVRPLLCLTRPEVEAYLAEHGLPHREDGTNAEDGCDRNRLRHRVLPELRAIWPGVSRAVSVSSELLRADEEYLTGLARAHLDGHLTDGALSVSALAPLPDPVAGRVLRLWWPRSLSSEHVSAALSLIRGTDPSARLSLPGATLRREYDRILFAPESGDVLDPVELTGDRGEAILPAAGLRLFWEKGTQPPGIYKSFTSFFFKTADICGKITVRPRREGDEVDSAGGGVTKRVKKRMIEAKIPRGVRERIPVIADGAGVLGVYGLCRSGRALAREGEDVTILRFEELVPNDDHAE